MFAENDVQLFEENGVLGICILGVDFEFHITQYKERAIIKLEFPFSGEEKMKVFRNENFHELLQEAIKFIMLEFN